MRDKTVTITLSLPKVFFGAIFALVGLVWVFIFGVMLGRGHNPEEVVPKLAQVMPVSPHPQPAPDPMEEVLQSKDLKYHDSLKGKNAAPPPRAAAPSPAPQPPAASAAAQKSAEQAKPVDPAKPGPQKPQPAGTPDREGGAYAYVYQVAAFTNPQQAQTLQQKLRGSGMSADISETQAGKTTWFRVLVNFRGKPDDTRTLREKLAAHGITNILLRDKTPIR